MISFYEVLMFGDDIKLWDANKDAALSATQAYWFNGNSFELIISGSIKVGQSVKQLNHKPAKSKM